MLLSKLNTTVDVPEILELIFVPPDKIRVAFGLGAVIVVDTESPCIVVQEFDGGADEVPSTNSNKSK
jgi:hypothetical protein